MITYLSSKNSILFILSFLDEVKNISSYYSLNNSGALGRKTVTIPNRLLSFTYQARLSIISLALIFLYSQFYHSSNFSSQVYFSRWEQEGSIEGAHVQRFYHISLVLPLHKSSKLHQSKCFCTNMTPWPRGSCAGETRAHPWGGGIT